MRELLITLLHIAVFLFLSGFIIYLFQFNPFVGVTAAVCIGVCVSLYLCISLAPIIFRDSSYHTPLSSLVWVVWMGVIWLGLQFRCYAANPGARPDLRQLLDKYYQRITKGITKDVEDMAVDSLDPPLYLDTKVASRTFNTLDGDHDMDKFLAAIPGFYSSAKVKRDGHIFEGLNSKQLPHSVISFLDRSLSSDLLEDADKQEHIKNCLKAINSDPLLLECTFRQALLSASHSTVFKCVDFVHLSLAQSWVHDKESDADRWVREYARCVVAIAINRISDYDDKWISIVQRHLGLPKSRIKRWRSQGDSVRLCNLIHLIRKLEPSQLNVKGDFEPGTVLNNSIIEACRLKVENAAPELRHEFCALWNGLVDVAKGRVPAPLATRLNTIHILSVIRNVFISLHGGVKFLPAAYRTPVDDHQFLQSAPFYPACAGANYHENQEYVHFHNGVRN